MAKLSSAQRKALSAKVFGLPDKRAYPMPDASHARNALSRASANATPAEQKKIRAKAHKLYPGMSHAGDPGKLHPLSSMAA